MSFDKNNTIMEVGRHTRLRNHDVNMRIIPARERSATETLGE